MTTTSCTSTSITRAVHRRRLLAAVLALPLSLAMTGTALAVGSTDRGPAENASIRVAADASPGKSDDKAAEKAADKAAEQAEAKNEAKDERAEVAAAKAEERAEAKAEAKSEAKNEAAPAKAAEKAPQKSEAKSEAQAAKAAAPSNGAQHGPATSGPLTKPQPLSNADKNGTGANPGETCTDAYCSTRNGSASGNGKGDGVAAGKPCAGCVGKADNKNPKGQAPNGSDNNAGYECDRNQGIGKTNPAHTGCTGATSSPTSSPRPTKSPKPSKSPKPPKSPKPSTSPDTGNEKITFCHATGSAKNPYVVITTSKAAAVNGHLGRDHQGGRDIIPAFTYKGVSYAAQGDPSLIGTGCVKPGVVVLEKCPDGSAMPAGGAKDCPKPPKTCPNGQTMPGGNPANCPTTPPVCPTVMPVSGPVMAGCFPTNPPITPPTGGGGTPTTGVVQQPVTRPVSRPVPVGPVVVPNNAVNPTVITGPVTLPVERPVAAAAPSTLPFTGADTGLLAALGALLLLAGVALMLAVQLGRPARRTLLG